MMNVTVVPGGPCQPMPVNGAAITTTGPGTGNWVPKASTYSTYQVIAAAAATVVIEATNETPAPQGSAGNPVLLNTITLAGAGSGGFSTASNWRYVRARVTAGAAAISVLQGV